ARPVRRDRPSRSAAARARLVEHERYGVDRLSGPGDEGLARDHHRLEPRIAPLASFLPPTLWSLAWRNIKMAIIGWIVVGLIAGVIARWIMPGPDPMGWLGTIVLGIVGSLVGGTLLNLVFGGGFELTGAGFLGSILGALIVLFVWRRMRPAATVP